MTERRPCVSSDLFRKLRKIHLEVLVNLSHSNMN